MARLTSGFERTCRFACLIRVEKKKMGFICNFVSEMSVVVLCKPQHLHEARSLCDKQKSDKQRKT